MPTHCTSALPGSPGVSQSKAPDVASTRPGGNRVLVVDDDRAVRVAFQRALDLAGFDATVASGGGEGLEILRDDPTIDLVLLDLMMPEMDGW